jgi:hypothetical protein
MIESSGCGAKQMSKRGIRLLVATALVTGTLSSANAATIKSDNDEGVNVISIMGRIDATDDDRFDQLASGLTGPTVVVLHSPGGLVIEGLNIGIAVRRHRYTTVVPDDAMCASICGMIWLAGQPRLLGPNSKIGFHAARRGDGQESGKANALIGAYLTKLGLSYDAIVYMTDAAPDDMQWLNPDDATKYGITYSLVSPPKSEPRPFIAPQPQYSRPPQPQYQPPSAPAASPAEQQATRLVQAYYANWSQGGTNVENLARYYADAVSFYGGTISREKLMEEKRKFSVRWPIRQYNIGSLSVLCGDGGCSVTGIVAWDCTNQERGEHSIGTANFALRIVNGVIVSENGSVLTGRKETVESQAAASTVAYGQGRQARIGYEQWVNSLPPSGYKDGVLFWAAHRSDKLPPSCMQPGALPDWQAGCLANRTRLAPIDVRRTTEKDFWWGWNSL